MASQHPNNLANQTYQNTTNQKHVPKSVQTPNDIHKPAIKPPIGLMCASSAVVITLIGFYMYWHYHGKKSRRNKDKKHKSNEENKNENNQIPGDPLIEPTLITDIEVQSE